MAGFLVISGCGYRVYLGDGETGRVTAVPASLKDVCHITSTQALRDAEDVIELLAFGRRNGVPREVALAGSISECGTLLDCFLCAEGLVDEVYGGR